MSNMAQYTTASGTGPGGAGKSYQQPQGGNHSQGVGGRPPAQAPMQGRPNYSQGCPAPTGPQNTQGARGGQRLTDTNPQPRNGRETVYRGLNRLDEKAQQTSPYTAALMMATIFAIIWGTGLLVFGLLCK